MTRPITVFALVLVGHLAMLNRFGVSWDEPMHRRWGQLFIAFVSTGDTRLLEQMPGHGIYYGPLYHAISYALSSYLTRTWDVPLVSAAHVLNVVTFALCCALVYAIASQMFSRIVAGYSTLFVALSPHLIGHAQYNPKDIPLMTAATAAVFASYLALSRRTVSAALWAGVWFGCALAVKLSAVIVAAVIAPAFVAQSLSRRQTTRGFRRLALLACVACGTAALSLVFLWPSLWFEPSILAQGLYFFRTNFWPHEVLYLGTIYKGQDLPWHYVPFHLLAGTTLPTLVCGCMGIAVSVRRALRGHLILEHLLILTWLIGPLVVSAWPSLVRYDGYRQFLFVLPPLGLLAGLGLATAGDMARRMLPVAGRLATPALGAAVSLVLCYESAQIYPHTGSYVNPLVRWYLGQSLEKQIELEYWGTTYREGVRWLNANAHRNAEVCVPIAPGLIRWYPLRSDIRVTCGDSPSYLMYFTRTTFLPAQHHSFETLAPAPLFEVRQYKSRLLAIFDMTTERHSNPSGEAAASAGTLSNSRTSKTHAPQLP